MDDVLLRQLLRGCVLSQGIAALRVLELLQALRRDRTRIDPHVLNIRHLLNRLVLGDSRCTIEWMTCLAQGR